MHIAILGRQPEFGIAELERLYGAGNVEWFSEQSALVKTPNFNFEDLGGSQKAGRVVLQFDAGNWHAVSQKIVQHYTEKWRQSKHKITLGISASGFKITPREVQKTGLIIKKNLRESSVNMRLIPNSSAALNTATSHHNKLGLSSFKVELIVVRSRDSRRIVVAESVGAQNITAYSRRDRGRPRRDAFVGMLPPKLAQIMINLATGENAVKSTSIDSPENPSESARNYRILDPFCGTGTVLQEALLKNYSVYGTDLSQKMVDYTKQNLAWLLEKFHSSGEIFDVHQADAMDFHWDESQKINAVVCEAYLGQPFSAPPKAETLRKVTRNCNHIISEFLKNLHPQLQSDTSLCIAVPAWRDKNGKFTHLPLLEHLEDLGYCRVKLQHTDHSRLIYFRENQVVAREILILSPVRK